MAGKEVEKATREADSFKDCTGDRVRKEDRGQEVYGSSNFVTIIDLSEGRLRVLLREMVNEGTIEKAGQN